LNLAASRGSQGGVFAFGAAYTRGVLNHAIHHADARLTEFPPCDGCRFAARCGIEGLACAAFSMYLADEPAVRWRLAPRAPTTARYTALGLRVGAGADHKQ
jgi:hypothetical protein